MWLLVALALGHGGAPSTSEVLFGAAGDVTLVTSHGVIAEDRGWTWFCEELVGELYFSTGVARTGDLWWMSTTSGVLASSDGCHWEERLSPSGLTSGVAADVGDPEWVWTGTHEGLWLSDGGEFALQTPTDFPLRDFAQLGDGRFALLGFDDVTPVLQIGAVRAELPVEAGGMKIIAVDSSDRVYVHFPLGQQSSLARVDDRGGVELLLDRVDYILDVAEADGELYAVVSLLGTMWSADDGETWSSPAGERLECLVSRDGGLYGCPGAGAGIALSFTEAASPNPAEWTWSSLLEFSEVEAAVCPVGSSVEATCDALWPTVAWEFGVEEGSVDTGPLSEPASAGGCGCASSGSAGWLQLFPALLLGLRRRS